MPYAKRPSDMRITDRPHHSPPPPEKRNLLRHTFRRPSLWRRLAAMVARAKRVAKPLVCLAMFCAGSKSYSREHAVNLDGWREVDPREIFHDNAILPLPQPQPVRFIGIVA